MGAVIFTVIAAIILCHVLTINPVVISVIVSAAAATTTTTTNAATSSQFSIDPMSLSPISSTIIP